jgi:prepilin-type N-terminal cleavage/methylation domain-containing protein
MKRRIAPGAAGYTLLEMLVALVVFGLLMAGLAQAYRYGLTALAAGQRAIAAPADLAAVDMALRRMIETAQLDSLSGGPVSLAFTTSLPEAAGAELQCHVLQAADGPRHRNSRHRRAAGAIHLFDRAT